MNFEPGKAWLDASGRRIQAHGGGMLHDNGVYYWYGEDRDYARLGSREGVRAIGVRCYSSPDLFTWRDEGLVLPATADDEKSEIHFSRVMERPKVIKNDLTGKYVMWLHLDDAPYKFARVGISVADKPTGPFRLVKSVRPDDSESRDMTLFKDDDGRAYLVHSSENNRTMHVSLLAPDYMGTSGEWKRVFEGRMREAPAVFKHGGRYYIVSSHCTGWKPNAAEYAAADSMLGEWKVLGNPCAGSEEDKALTFNSQSTFVLPVPGRPGKFIFMADRWNPGDLGDSRYIWLPLKVENGLVSIEWREKWGFDVFD